MTYNLGMTRLLGFKKMLEAFADADFEEAALQMIDSKWADQVGKRADTLANIIKFGYI
jgi:lysozyme